MKISILEKIYKSKNSELSAELLEEYNKLSKDKKRSEFLRLVGKRCITFLNVGSTTHFEVYFDDDKSKFCFYMDNENYNISDVYISYEDIN